MEILQDGTVRVHLDVPLQVLQSSSISMEVGKGGVAAGGGKRGHATLTLLGMLELLWEGAGLHRWHPLDGQRRLSIVYRKLLEEIDDVRVGRTPGIHGIYVPDTLLDEVALKRKAEDVRSRFEILQKYCRETEAPVLLVIGEVRSLFKTVYGAGLKIKGMPDQLTIWLSRPLTHEITRRFERQVMGFMAGEQKTTKTIGIVGVRRSGSGTLHATCCGLLETSADYIPVDSDHEARLAVGLVNGRRHFSKPLRHSSKLRLHPDFVLHDSVGGDWHLEVWGMSTPAYHERKRSKIEVYRQLGMRLWQWDATTQLAIPPLPVKAVEIVS